MFSASPLGDRIVVTVLILGVAVWFFLTTQFGDAKASFAAYASLRFSRARRSVPPDDEAG